MFYKKADNIRLSTKKHINPGVMGECNVFCLLCSVVMYFVLFSKNIQSFNQTQQGDDKKQ